MSWYIMFYFGPNNNNNNASTVLAQRGGPQKQGHHRKTNCSFTLQKQQQYPFKHDMGLTVLGLKSSLGFILVETLGMILES